MHIQVRSAQAVGSLSRQTCFFQWKSFQIFFFFFNFSHPAFFFLIHVALVHPGAVQFAHSHMSPHIETLTPINTPIQQSNPASAPQ